MAASEHQVATWILRNPEDVIQSSMAIVAKACGVSDTTVLRFCRNAGFSGYLDLKMSITRDLSSPIARIVHDDIGEEDPPATIARKVFASHIQALYDTLEVLDEKLLDSAVKMIVEAKRILIVGVGTSTPIVHEAYIKFFRLGLNVHVQTDSYLQLMEAAIVDEETLVIAISHSGSSIDPNLTLEEAKRNGAKTLVITGNEESPLTKHADVTLLAVAQETRAEAVASRIAQMSLVDTLYIIVSSYLLDQTAVNEDKIWRAILQKSL